MPGGEPYSTLRKIWARRSTRRTAAIVCLGAAPVLVAVFLGERSPMLAVIAVLLELVGWLALAGWTYWTKLNAQRRRFRDLVDRAEAILWEAHPDAFHVSFVSHSVERLLGYPRERWLQEPRFWEEHLHPDDRDRTVAEALAHVRAGEDYELQYRMVAADGRTVWLRDIVRISRDASGTPAHLTGVCVDITARKAMEGSLRESESRKNAILDAALDCVITIDAEGLIVEFNPAAERTFGYARHAVIGERMSELIVPPSLREAHTRGFDHHLATGEGPVLGKRLELPAMRADGSEFPAELTITRVDLAGTALFTAYLRDITDRKRAEAAQKQVEEELKRQALHDSLTGLPNRTLFNVRGEHALELARREGSCLAVAIIDLDRFKEINDTLGHGSGDRVLDELGKRLQASLRESDTVARLGGDEFGLVFPCSSRSKAVQVVEHVQGRVTEMFTVDGVPLEIEASAGVALFPEHGAEVGVLLQRADVAMYVAKRSGSSLAIYDPSQDTYHPSRLALAAEVRQAMERRELVIHYQPQVALRTGEVTGAEALLRWLHPTRGLLAPTEFIPYLEHTGLMRPMTLYVLDEALRQCRSWERSMGTPRVSVNVSVRSLIDGSFVNAVEGLLQKWGVEPARLTLEITESGIVTDPFRVTGVLEQLGAVGLRLSVDDFGAGYSSLAHLRRLPLGEIKIDRSFVERMSRDRGDEMIVRSTIDLAHGLGLEVVAEGVDTAETFAELRRLQCDTAQGHHLSRPLPADQLVEWLAGRTRAVVPFRRRTASA